MRVLIQPRPAAPTRQGGDWLQLQATLEPLRARGVHADISTDADADLSQYDICLIWNGVEPLSALAYYFNARRQNKRVALMPFYWSMARLFAAEAAARGMNENSYAQDFDARQQKIFFARHTALLRAADSLLPNSNLEAARVIAENQVAPERVRIVWNGVAQHFAHGDAARFRSQFRAALGDADFILCVAQITPRKNQLTLLRALQDDARHMVFMGARDNEIYARQCEQVGAARGSVTFLPRQEQTTVADAMAAARVHALVSIQDVAPLVTMEAAMAATPQVVTTECGMREYYGDAAWYADPETPDEIRRATDAAWNAPRAVELQKRLAREFTWERTARELHAALEWTLTCEPSIYDPAPALLETNELLEQQIALLWQWLQSQGENARQVEQWAHELQTQLRAQKTFGARVKALVGK